MGRVTPHPSSRPGLISSPARLDASHDLSRFDCGAPILDDWLRRHAFQSEGRTIRTYVVCSGKNVVGFHSIATGSVERRFAPKKLQRNAPDPIPVAIVGRLAVDKGWHGKGLGADLLSDAFHRILAAHEIIGIRAVLIHAIDEASRSFYMSRAEFIEFPADTRTLFLPIETIIDAL